MKKIALMCTAVCLVTASAHAVNSDAAARFQNAVRAAQNEVKKPATVARAAQTTADEAFGTMHNEETGEEVDNVQYTSTPVQWDEPSKEAKNQPHKKKNIRPDEMTDKQFAEADAKHKARIQQHQQAQQEDDMTGVSDLFREEPAIAEQPQQAEEPIADQPAFEAQPQQATELIVKRSALQERSTNTSNLGAKLDQLITEMNELRDDVARQAKQAEKLKTIEDVLGKNSSTSESHEPKAVRD